MDPSELEIFDEVILSSGKIEEVKAIEIVKLDEEVTVYKEVAPIMLEIVGCCFIINVGKWSAQYWRNKANDF